MSLISELLLGFGPTLLLVALFVLLARRAQSASGLGGLGNFGRSQARRVDPQAVRVTFDDVAGIDDAKGELTEIVDFLQHPARYQRLGGRIPATSPSARSANAALGTSSAARVGPGSRCPSWTSPRRLWCSARGFGRIADGRTAARARMVRTPSFPPPGAVRSARWGAAGGRSHAASS
jgi:hypothetical protein